jgi:hypothetical protein
MAFGPFQDYKTVQLRAERKSCSTKCVTAWLSEVYKRDSHFQSPIAVVLTAAMSACQVSGEGAVECTPVVPHHTLQNTSKTNLKSSSHFFLSEKNPMSFS